MLGLLWTKPDKWDKFDNDNADIKFIKCMKDGY